MHRYYHPEVGVPDVFAPAGPPILDHYPYAAVPIIQFIPIRSLKIYSTTQSIFTIFEKRGKRNIKRS